MNHINIPNNNIINVIKLLQKLKKQLHFYNSFIICKEMNMFMNDVKLLQ